MENFILNYNNIHPKAKEILKDEFYWDLTNPNSPFSINRISNSFQEFEEWRREHSSEDAIDFLPVWDENGFIFDRDKTDVQSIENFCDMHYQYQKQMLQQYFEMMKSANIGDQLSEEEQNEGIEETARQQGITMLKEQDDKIISAGFGQFILEGKIDSALKIATEKAIERQLNPFVIAAFHDEDFQHQRKRDLKQLFSDLNEIA
ncbi:hypothetical protein [Taibaiella chishuiensis]|nr:hypothetical protein [Taibaiella chishuiensis]